MANLPIRVGIIGVHPDKGWASTAHIPALRQLPDFQLTAVSNHDIGVARAAAQKFGIAHADATAEDLINRPDVDLVVVAVKVMRHRELVLAALKAGKAVLCEWPLGTDVKEAEAIRDAAKATGSRGFVGIQTRASPAINFVRSLLHEGYVGRVISSTLIGSGILWGDELPEAYVYTLDPANGASMINVPVGHTIDAVLYGLDSTLVDFTARTASVRDKIRILETGDELAMRVPDQIAVAGQLENGIFLNLHFRGGTARATNFHWEINGTKGDIVVTSPIAYTGVGGFRVRGASDAEGLRDLQIPADFDHGFAAGLTQSIAIAYRRIAEDILTGSSRSPTFEDALVLHRLIAAIEKKGRERP